MLIIWIIIIALTIVGIFGYFGWQIGIHKDFEKGKMMLEFVKNIMGIRVVLVKSF